MRRFKDLHGKEKANTELYPLILLFRWLGKNIKLLSAHRRQLTAFALCAVLIMGAIPLTSFADNQKLTVVTEFLVGKNRINVEDSPDNYWSYGTDSAVTKTNVESLPESGWTWAIQSNLTTAEYAIKLNNYNGSYIIASSIHYWSNNKCKLDLEVSGNNTVTSQNYGFRLGCCDTFLHGDGNLTVKTEDARNSIEATSLVVDLSSNKALNITASGSDGFGSTGIDVITDFVLNSGAVKLDVTNSSTDTDYGAIGITAQTVTVNGGSLNIVSTNTSSGGSFGIRGAEKYNDEKKKWEYPANVYFNNGSVEITAGMKATDTINPPEVAEGFKIWAGKTTDKSDKEVYNPENSQNYLYYTTAHTHCKCGAYSSHEKSNVCSYYDQETYKPWTDPTSLPHGYTSYYLTTDVVLDETWNMNYDMNLCLNGHSIIAKGDFDVIKLSRTLYLTDCSAPDKQGKITHAEGKTGRGIVTEDHTQFMRALNMYGGNITGNTAEDGAGVYCATKVAMTIKGGSITNNVATGNGGGIYCKGDVKICNGNITGNSANIGGGVYVTKGNSEYSKYDSFEMEGGNITGNTATEKGGGVYGSHFVVLSGYVEDYSSYKLPVCSATVIDNTSGPEGSKKTDNIEFAPGYYLNIYNNFTGGNVYLNFTGDGATAAVPYSNLTSTLYLNAIPIAGIHCNNPRYAPVLDRTNNKAIFRKSLEYLSTDDFVFTPPTGNLTYNGQAKTATVTAKPGIDCGKITVKYFDENHIQVASPTRAGRYIVSIDVEENDKYAELTGIHDTSWAFTITPKEVSTSDIQITGINGDYIYTGSAIEPTPKVTVDGKELYKYSDFDVTYENNTAIGHATATITLKGNYSGSRKVEFRITYGHASDKMYDLPAANENGWYCGDVTITAADGYTIGETAQSFSDSLILTGDTAKGGKQIFLKAADGKVYCTVVSYKIDTVAPENVTVQYNKNGYNSLLSKITFGLFFKDTVTVEAQATDALSGVDKILYYAADDEIQDTQSITDWQDSLSLTSNGKKLIYVKVTDKAGNSVILLDQGVVVYGDSAVSPASAEFDLKPDKQEDVALALSLNDNTLREIKNGDTVLKNGIDYTVSANTVTILKDYLAGFDEGTTQKLTFVFNPLGEQGETVSTCVATIKLIDSTHRHNPVKHAAIAPTCTEDGSKEYYICTCGKMFEDETAEVEITDFDSIKLSATGHDWADATCTQPKTCKHSDCNATDGNPLGHDYSTVWFNDAANHWHECSRCHGKADETAHCPDRDAATETDPVICTECGWLIAPCHTHSPQKVYDKAATCTKDGTKAHYECSCGKLFEDESATVEIADPSILVIPAIGHDYEWKIDKEATADENGSKHEECKNCGDKKAAVVISKTGNKTTTSTDSAKSKQTDKSPATGTGSDTALWITLLFAVGAGVIGIKVYSPKKRKLNS